MAEVNLGVFAEACSSSKPITIVKGLLSVILIKHFFTPADRKHKYTIYLFPAAKLCHSVYKVCYSRVH